MAEDSPKNIEFRAELPRKYEDFLGSIRDWSNIQVASDDEVIWLKGFTDQQAASSELKQLPDFLIYEVRDGWLFRKNALIPSKKLRTGLLWSPIEKALRLSFPPSNQNFFGIHEKVNVKLKSSEEEHSALALISSISEIKDEIITVPKFKLEMVRWIVIDENALFVGLPLLSFPGKTYWEKDGHLLPSGFDFEFKNLSLLLQKKYNKASDLWLLWAENGSYLPVPRNDLQKLSVSSFRLTEKAKEWS